MSVPFFFNKTCINLIYVNTYILRKISCSFMKLENMQPIAPRKVIVIILSNYPKNLLLFSS